MYFQDVPIDEGESSWSVYFAAARQREGKKTDGVASSALRFIIVIRSVRHKGG